MSWKGLRHKGTEVLRSSEWNAVVDALDELHDMLTTGESDITVRNVNARVGNFSDNVYVQGKAVLKDGDPITVAEFGDVARQQITSAVDASAVINAILSEYRPVHVNVAVSATENTEGVVVTLEKGGRPYVDIFYRLGGAGELYVEVSVDGVNWRTLDSWTFDGAREGMLYYAAVVYPYVRVRVPTVNIAVEIEIVASR